ncbi:Ktr system potassium uptake protein A [Chlamydia abortus]|uniref:Potassium channel family protein n=1 Tax=Paenibacillus residui TaxID=629724 RepID=A0ABW3D438_9BACL|nr:TrkA family potassium uptake protein [Paenibacillus sp. 32O-W]SHE13599.1 Ktr system potassium uptake protein A [Chlamydia abortus]
MKKQFAIIGMGRFGSSVAKSLSKSGYDVLAVDSNGQKVQEMSAFVTQAVQADSTDEEALKALGIHHFDVVVVAIGQDIQSSILTTLILKDLGIQKIIVKAQNDLHGNVLKKIGADKVIFPERDMGNRVAHHLISPNILDYVELSDDYSIVEIKASPQMIGKSLLQLDIRAKYRCNVMAIKTGTHMNIAPHAEDAIKEDDVLVVVGKNEDLVEFEKTFTK